LDKLLQLALEASREAGISVMRYYNQILDVQYKHDGSPLTLADKASHLVISDYLSDSGLVVVSEESEDLHFSAEQYWLVDPLDGTKDFLVGNGEFTINIALIDKGRPVLGVIFAPAINTFFWGSKGIGAWQMRDGIVSKLFAHARSASPRMAVSRFHDHPDVEFFAAQNKISERVAIGSALKYGLLARGDVDVFPRLVGSSEWDTGAGQAVIEAAGGEVLDWHTGKALAYGKLGRRNPRLLALRAPYSKEEFQLKDYESELL
jgi:3'(2'), 5'-bisphosphate nucleotidase